MRRIALIFIPLFFVACSGEPTAPPSGHLKAPVLASQSNGADTFRDRHDLTVDWLLTPADYPCLKESIYVSGTVSEYVNVVDSKGSLHVNIHQTTNDVTAVGVPSGTRYQFSGALNLAESGLNQDGGPIEFTFRNIAHIVGPGSASDIFLGTLLHVTYYPSGETKVEISKDGVRCN